MYRKGIVMPEDKQTLKENQLFQSASLNKIPTFEDLLDQVDVALREARRADVRESISKLVIHELQADVQNLKDYHVLIQYDDTSMKRIDADNIYKALKNANIDKKKDILLILFSFGGDIASAYLISKLCREYSKGRFVVAVPRMAKSAATLICCGADEIHMGSLSELGPLDPQFNHLLALGLKNTIRQIAETVTEFPKSSNLFSEYLAKTIAPIDLGYYDRIVDSASQYARRLLLKRHNAPTEGEIQKLTTRLVYEYSDHGFVIDKSEAMEIFGNSVVKIDTPEYALANKVYTLLNLIERRCASHYQLYFIGNYDAPNSVGLINQH